MSTDWKEIESKYYMFVVRRLPVVIVKGQGSRVWDDTGKEYLDFIAGWAVDSIGHCNPVIVKAVTEQVKTLIQTSNQFYTIPQLKLAQLLIDNSCLDRVFFANSGAEANEGAVKLARKYGKMHRNGAFEVITALNSFHGRTLMMTAATGQPAKQAVWQPLPPGFTYVPYNDVEAIIAATTDRTAAVMLEPVQGEGGVNIPSPDYLQKVRDWCNEKGMLLIFDEVQTGLGRIGKLFGYQVFGVEPDVITLAKGLGGGLPIGAFMAKQHACVLEPGDHGSTFGGNALTCAAAYATTKYIIDNDLSGQAAKLGEILRKGLKSLQRSYKFIVDVRGIGLLFAVEFSSNITPNLVSACIEEGLLVNPLRPNAIRLMPPLTVSASEIDEALKKLEKGLAKVASTAGASKS